jgi:hypothetical protein
MTSKSDAIGRGCVECRTIVDECAFCERADCPEIVCSRCLRVELRESAPEPHPHGG